MERNSTMTLDHQAGSVPTGAGEYGIWSLLLRVLDRYHAHVIPVICFLIYINAPAVAVRFHGIPSAIAQLALVPLFIPLCYYVLVKRDGIIVTRSLPWIVTYVVILLVSALISENPLHAMDTVKMTIIEGLAIYIVFTNIVRRMETVRNCIWAILAAGTFMGSLSFLQQLTGTFNRDYGGFAQVATGEGFYMEEDRGEVRQRRLAGPIGEQNRYAQFMLMVIPLGVACVATARTNRMRMIAGLGTLLTAMGCALTFSRGAAVGFALTLFVAMLLGLVSPRQLIGLALVGLFMMLALPQYRSRILTLVPALNVASHHAQSEEVDGAVKGRATSMLAAARIWFDYPILGVGPDLSQFQTRKYGQAGGMRALEGNRKAHCLYLEIGAECGTVGLICFGMIIYASMKQLIRLRNGNEPSRNEPSRDPFVRSAATAFLLSVCSYLMAGIFLHFSYIRYFWMVLALADSIQASAERSVRADA